MRLSGRARPLLAGVAIFLAGMIAGGTAVHLRSARDGVEPTLPHREKAEGQHKLVSPLLECGIPLKELTSFEHKVRERIEELTARKELASMSVYFEDLDTGSWFGFNERERFAPASLLKLPVLIAYLKLAESEPAILAQRYEVPPGVGAGGSASVKDLLQQMIILSDNQILQLLVRDAEAHFARPFRDLGLPLPGSESQQDFLDVKTYASFFRILYNATYLDERMSQAALELLTKTKFVHGLQQGVPPGVLVAHKWGELNANAVPGQPPIQFHDCGIIYYPGRPYLLCVMSRGDSEKELIESIRDISSTVYAMVDRQLAP